MTFNINAQILSNGVVTNNISNSNVMLDGSTTYSIEAGSGANIGKGIIVPSVDLVNFEFDLNLADGSTFPTYFDGMLVYNNSANNTLTTGNRSSTSTAVTPGFYYFSNPNGASNGNVSSGIWTPMGSNASKDFTAAEVTTSISIDGAPVYAKKGTFIANGTTATTTIVPPAGITGIYRITIYQTEVSTDTATLGNTITRRLSSEVYDFNLSLSTDNVTTGRFPFSEVYPFGTYDYTLEYFK